MSPIVRPSMASDLPQVAALWQSLHRLHHAAAPKLFRPQLELVPCPAPWDVYLGVADAALLVAANPGDDVVGFAALSVGVADSSVLHRRRVTAIDAIAVDVRCQRKGVGRLLLAAAEHWAHAMVALEVWLNVWDFNRGAKALYESAGYSVQRLGMAKTLG